VTDIDHGLAVGVLAEKHIEGAVAVVLASPPEGPLRGVQVPARVAFAAWTALREAVPRTGAWPIVIGNEPQLAQLDRDAEPVDGILENATSIDLQAWAAQEVATDPERFQAPSAPWPETVEHATSFHVLQYLAKRTEPAVIALVPTTLPHEVPAYLRFGGWNACPSAEVHVALFRTWHERFGAEPVVMAGDTVELLVRNPVAAREEALALAQLQYVYCNDIVDQGVESIEALAATLLGDPRWFFWWD
jgi:hypothetical protein